MISIISFCLLVSYTNAGVINQQRVIVAEPASAIADGPAPHGPALSYGGYANTASVAEARAGTAFSYNLKEGGANAIAIPGIAHVPTVHHVPTTHTYTEAVPIDVPVQVQVPVEVPVQVPVAAPIHGYYGHGGLGHAGLEHYGGLGHGAFAGSGHGFGYGGLAGHVKGH